MTRADWVLLGVVAGLAIVAGFMAVDLFFVASPGGQPHWWPTAEPGPPVVQR